MNQNKNKKVLNDIQENVADFLEENKLSVFQIKEDYLTSKELGEEYKVSAVKTNKLLEEKGYLEKDKDKNWKLSKKGENYGFTPIKMIITLKDQNIIMHLKKENPRWFKCFQEHFAEIMKKESEENKNGTK